MSGMDRFEAWWQTLNVYDPTMKALAGSAWMEATRSLSTTSDKDPTDATNFVFVRESPNLELLKRWEVIFFVPSAPAQERECLIGAFEMKEAAEQEAKEFIVTLQKIIDAIKPAEMW